MHFNFTLHDTLIFLTGVAIPAYNILEWGNKHFGRPIERLRAAVKRLLIRNESEAALYLRYKEQAARKKS